VDITRDVMAMAGKSELPEIRRAIDLKYAATGRPTDTPLP